MLTRTAALLSCILLTGCNTHPTPDSRHAPATPAATNTPTAPAPAPTPAAPNPEARAAHLRAATAAFNSQDFPTAVREYEAAINAGADTPLVHFRYGYALHVTGRHADALTHHIAATRIDNPALRIDALYNAACASALLGRRDDALGFLSRAVHAGFKDIAQVRKDTDLDTLRGDKDFDELVAVIERAAETP